MAPHLHATIEEWYEVVDYVLLITVTISVRIIVVIEVFPVTSKTHIMHQGGERHEAKVVCFTFEHITETFKQLYQENRTNTLTIS